MVLDKQCQKIEKETDEKYSNGLIYNKERGMIVPDSSSDELYAGGYFPRRYPEESVSIEMLWYYSDPQIESDKRMVIITGIFDEESAAKVNLKKVQKIVPQAYIKKVRMYMGCMH